MISLGCGPVEDCGSIEGWNDVKAAFRSSAPTVDQNHLQSGAKKVSGLGESYNPFAQPNITVMNYEGRWENHLQAFMIASGEEVKEFDEGSDDELDDLE
jgi:hypothetical protein